MSDQAREHAASLRMARHILANCECRYASQAWESYKELDAIAESLAAERVAREQAERALRIAEAALHSWSVLNTRTDPRESQRMGRDALDHFRDALADSGGTGQ